MDDPFPSTSTSDKPRLAYRPNEAAELIGISRMSLYQLLASREIPSRLHGRKRLILAEDLQAWLKGLREW